jgi:N-acetyltransferase
MGSVELKSRLLLSDHIALEPLEDRHFGELEPLVSDSSLWAWWPREMVKVSWTAAFATQMEDHLQGRQIVHVVRCPNGEVAGQTCYLNARPNVRSVEIGGTWYARKFHGSCVNPAAKALLIQNAFAEGIERIEIKTDSRNAHSRAAILKLGAKFEGIFRRHMINPDGSWRDTAWYSILRDEADDVLACLNERLAAGHQSR